MEWLTTFTRNCAKVNTEIIFLAYVVLAYIHVYMYNYRNLSLVVNEKQCQSMVGQDIMTPLSAMIRDCLTKLDQIRIKKYRSGVRPMEGASTSGEGGKAEGATCISARASRRRLKTDIEEEQWRGALEQGLHLLWNVMWATNYILPCRAMHFSWGDWSYNICNEHVNRAVQYIVNIMYRQNLYSPKMQISKIVCKIFALYSW